ncbi:aldose 1-epimerase [Companilactobacillus paralimentarius DSM 13238 = JCM 10415]|uniref:Aldose 1-epimerase n=1 Tax=Companilactobacillus paralimentarius DSM 13238 = JCM 10415 TaxID=1122151 RepID=A0A0R1PDX9_9LACO|nr:aldose epimerase family protein [Companilactobacillus paralimentarius]KAE9564656.1 galactose mutarotase [Companilactobacillus paralimentarius]KRL30704.1 aldose 1-epimerase [Companilactobacillus paralimentarius DSM 13238 = JCM 10415]QFR70552.1 galactose mutarotase [Companilactobacillus paralimentarius]
MGISKTIFGEIDSEPVYLYKITNKNQTSISIISYAATWQNFEVVEDGKKHSLIEHFDNLEDYIKTPYQVGKTIGRVAGRIKDATFKINDESYQMEQNEGENFLHGGSHGLQYQNFSSRQISNKAVMFSHTVRGEDGFPGKLEVNVIYMLTDNDEVYVTYGANTDHDTLFNLTCHVYFDVDDENISQQQLQINSEKLLEVDDGKIPTGQYLPTEGPYDFKKFKTIGKGLDQLSLLDKHEYDDTFVVDGHAATIKSDKRAVDLYTDRNGMVIFTANPEDAQKAAKYDYSCLAMELQTLPDAIHHPGFGDIVLSKYKKVAYTNKYKYRRLD